MPDLLSHRKGVWPFVYHSKNMPNIRKNQMQSMTPNYSIRGGDLTVAKEGDLTLLNGEMVLKETNSHL
jgi:hypothetical protein